MAETEVKFQQGRVLHDAIMGAFRARGLQLDMWCGENGVRPSQARSATYGQSGGKRGRELLDRLIEAAGRDSVERAYKDRLSLHLEQIKQGAE